MLKYQKMCDEATSNMHTNKQILKTGFNVHMIMIRDNLVDRAIWFFRRKMLINSISAYFLTV